MCLDKGYDFEEVRLLLKELKWTPHIRTRGEEIITERVTNVWLALQRNFRMCSST